MQMAWPARRSLTGGVDIHTNDVRSLEVGQGDWARRACRCRPQWATSPRITTPPPAAANALMASQVLGARWVCPARTRTEDPLRTSSRASNAAPQAKPLRMRISSAAAARLQEVLWIEDARREAAQHGHVADGSRIEPERFVLASEAEVLGKRFAEVRQIDSHAGPASQRARRPIGSGDRRDRRQPRPPGA